LVDFLSFLLFRESSVL